MSEQINSTVAISASVAQVTFPVWWPDLDHSADTAAKLVPVFGAIAGAIYAANLLVTLVRNIRAARAEQGASDA